MNNFKRVSAAVLAGMTLLLASGVSHGLGFGRPDSRAILGDTLWVTVPLRLEAGEEIANECLAADVYFGEDKVAGSAVSATVLSGKSGEYTLKVSTTALINEPVVTVYLAAGCKARMTRKFVALADPPGMTMPHVAEAAPVDVGQTIAAVTMPAPSVVGQPSALSAAMQPSRTTSAKKPGPSTRQAKQVFSRAPSLALAARGGSKPDAVSKRKTTAAIQAPPVEAGRLVLDPVEAEAMSIPDLRMAATLGSPTQADDQSPDLIARRQAAAALWLAMNASPEQMLQDRSRLQELEQRLAQLKQESSHAQERVVALQARVQQAESASGSGKWLMLLGLIALGALALAAYLFKQLRANKRQTESWWQSQSSMQSIEPGVGDDSELGNTTAEFVHLASSTASESSDALLTRQPGYAQLHQLVPDAPPAAIGVPPTAPTAITVSHHNEPLREVSVEELIDLEQQAEFFVVLGQDDAAIDLLEGHVQNTTGASPLPFLKLMDIYRRVGKRAAYERVQAEFNQRFNAYAPAWDSDLQQGHTLADYPGVVERLQDLWSSPIKAMAVLEKSLTRPESGEDTFELPAYRELLFLYAVARDLSEREVQDRTSVDLLLPVMDLSSNEPAASVHGESVAPLMATRPIKALPEVRPSMSLDLHLDDLQPPEPPHKP